MDDDFLDGLLDGWFLADLFSGRNRGGSVPARPVRCRRAPSGWWCRRGIHLDGPCAALPRWWNRGHLANTMRSAARWPR